MDWLKNHAIHTLGMLLDTVQQIQIVGDIIQLLISMSVDTMARMYC